MRYRKDAPLDGRDDGCCRVCGRETELTFEHLPPKAANNRGRAEMLGIDKWLAREEHGVPHRPDIVQKGSGAYSLCGPCNNRSGGLYVPELLKWIDRVGGGLANCEPSVETLDTEIEAAYVTLRMDDVRPARFLKQVVTMLLALSPAGFPSRNIDLQCYAQDPNWTGLPPRYRFYLVAYCGPLARYNGGSAVLRQTEQGFGSTFTMELSYPPLSYVLSIDEDEPAVEAGDISAFANVGLDQTASVSIPMKVGFGHTVFPLDYRTRASLDDTIARNKAAAG